MNDLITLKLPREASAAQAEILQAVAAMDGVAASGKLTTRGLDPASIAVWFQVVTDGLGVAGALTGVLTNLFGLVREKGIKGVKVKIGNVEVDVDGSMSAKDVKALVTHLARVSRKA